EVGDCHFEYGPTSEYGLSTPCVPGASELGEGSADVAVSGEAEIEQLKPSTTYHYRLVATNPGGAGKGEDRTFTTDPAPPDSCPNAAFRDVQEFAVIMLPGCMALEMVSPPQKGNQSARNPMISYDGDRIRFQSVAALAETPGAFSVAGDPYVASRGSSGWTTASTSPPAGPEGMFRSGWDPSPIARSFTPDFSRWFQLAATLPQFGAGIDQAFEGGLGGFFSPLSPLMIPANLGVDPREGVEQSLFQGASPDRSHLYFVPGPGINLLTAYLPGDPEPVGPGADHNTYVARRDSAGEPSLELLARDRQGRVWGGNCGARLGGIGRTSISVASNGNRNQGAVSSDGSRVYFSTRPTQPAGGECDPAANKMRILER